MKSALALVVVMVLFAVPAFAGDVPQEALSALGLGGMQVVSDAEGMQVRGMSSRAFGSSFSFASGFLSYEYDDGGVAFTGFESFGAFEHSIRSEDVSGQAEAYAESGVEVATPIELTFDLNGSTFMGFANFHFGGFARAAASP